MRFVETPVFTRQIDALLPPEEYRAFQVSLVLRPRRGAVVRGVGGIRKIRWSRPGMGKRGGVRILYFWQESEESIYLLFAYAKNDREDLTRAQLETLRKVVEEELK